MRLKAPTSKLKDENIKELIKKYPFKFNNEY